MNGAGKGAQIQTGHHSFYLADGGSMALWNIGILPHCYTLL